jgi:hypothetical protein
MSYAAIAALLLQYGLPFVEGLITRIENKQQVTLADFQALKATAIQNTPENLLAQVAASLGIPPTDARYQQILALATAKPA